MYFDKNSKLRTEKVVKVVGNTLTLRNAYGERHRVHPKKFEILGVLVKRKIRFKKRKDYLEEIQWK